jgi:CHAT domain-containing protein
LSAKLTDANAAFKLFLEKQLLQELGRSGVNKIEYDRTLQSKLAKWGKGTAALYTVVSKDRYRVILTTPTVQVDGKFEIKAADLNKKIFAFRDALRDRSVDPRPLGKELYDILLKPIEKDLQAAGAKTLLWSLDGSLRYIPLAALSPDGKSYLIEKYTSAILTPKTGDAGSAPAAEWNVLGLGVSESLNVTDPDDPDKKINFRALPGAKKELLRIVRNENAPNETGILTGERFLDKDFTAKALADLLAKETEDGKQKFSVVHIASHFRLGNNWSNSFLLLGDGNILTLEQISNSPEISFENVDLITLSACNTAFAADSNGKETDSLAEAIQIKSGRSILATLWSVSDEGTSLLMGEFYRIRKETPGVTKAEAMQSAQKAMLEGKVKVDAEQVKAMKPETAPAASGGFAFDETRPFAHPYYWSPFILIGNWR